MQTLSNTYALMWELKGAEHYKFANDGTCINTKRGNKVKQVVNGRCVGGCINGKFTSAKRLRPLLRKIEPIDCPF